MASGTSIGAFIYDQLFAGDEIMSLLVLAHSRTQLTASASTRTALVDENVALSSALVTDAAQKTALTVKADTLSEIDALCDLDF